MAAPLARVKGTISLAQVTIMSLKGILMASTGPTPLMSTVPPMGTAMGIMPRLTMGLEHLTEGHPAMAQGHTVDLPPAVC